MFKPIDSIFYGFCFTALLLVLPLLLNAQKYQTEYYSLDQGLSDRLVTDVLVSRSGFVWIATENGLNKFDGYSFTVFDNDPEGQANPYISGNNIEALEEDADGNIVIFYNKNPLFFDIFNPLSYQNTRVDLAPGKGITGLVRSFHVDKKGRIYVAALNRQSMNIFEYRKGTFVNVLRVRAGYINPSAEIKFIRAANDLFWVNYAEKGLMVFNSKGEIVKHFSLGDFECVDSLPGNVVKNYILCEDKSGQIWATLAGRPGIFVYNPAMQFFEWAAGVPSDQFYAYLWEDQTGNILLAGASLFRAYPVIKELRCITPSGDMLDYSSLVLPNQLITRAAATDFTKTIFLGLDTGFEIVQSQQNPVRSYLAADLSASQRGTVIRGITENRKNKKVYFSREVESWYEIDLVSERLDTLPLIDEFTGEQIEFSCGLDVELDKSGNLWGITCYKSTLGQLHKIDLDTRKAKTYRFDYIFNAFYIDRTGLIWLVCDLAEKKGMLVSFDPQTEKFVTFTDKEGKNILENATPRYITQSKNGHLWIGTENGLFEIDTQKRYSRVYKRGKEDDNRFSGLNTIYVIHESNDGKIWYGTKSGLSILDPQTGRITTFSKKDGLAGNTVCGIIPDEKGNYWIATFSGLSYFNPSNKSFRNFYQSDGLTHDEFNRFSFHRDQNGRYYFGSVNGLNVFRAEDLLVERDAGPVLLTKITKFNSKLDSVLVYLSNLHNLKELVVAPSDSYFTIHFALPVRGSAKKNQYKVWLEGLDNNWTYLGNVPFIRYNSLPAGRYRLLIKGADANGNWSNQMLSLPIVVNQVYYKTWWFITASILLLGLLVRGLFQYKLDQQLQVERLRTKLSSDLHDEVSGLLAGIAMQSDMLFNQASEEESKHKLKTISEVSRKAMSKMSDVIWSIDSRKDRLSDLVDRMREHADEILAPLDIAYSITLSKLDTAQKLPANVRQDLYFIFKEAVNNVAKHAFATQVTINMGNEGTTFFLSIKDNGKPKTAQVPVDARGVALQVFKKTGQGLSNLKMRAERLHADLSIEKSDGYTIELRMKRFI
jgi:streptogramin lyase/two-component sensor histidine kinase